MTLPLVSIVIPTYKPIFLEQAIDCALSQTYPATEILVSDQCPGEDVREIIEKYPQIAYQRNPIPGVYSNFRNCIRLARGEYVKFLLDDDLLQPDCVQKLVSAIRKYPDATLVSSWYQLIDEQGEKFDVRKLDHSEPLVSSPGGGAPHILMSARNPIGPLTTSMFPRRALPLGLGPWFFHTGSPNQYFGLIDMTIILDLAFQGRAIILPEYLSAMRMHSEQLSNPEKNPRAIHTIRSWLPLVEDAHAFGLITDAQHRSALNTILDQFRRFLKMFPALHQDIIGLETRIARLR